jgi:general stress protein YciG
MWDLTVAQVHTFAVGTGAFVVHNSECDPTNTLRPGPYAGDSIEAARGPDRAFTKWERQRMEEIGRNSGCHTCGATNPGKGGQFIPDHQPPNRLNWLNDPQRLYPQCYRCSKVQGAQVVQFLRKVEQGLLDFWPRRQ